mmetsp:Transcript_25998/g.49800  ORF Transcript_25998/g.49800 Transcript_25998/m.49800 type:complete len:203 (-) Transcript_25998:1235-1843(-)
MQLSFDVVTVIRCLCPMPRTCCHHCGRRLKSTARPITIQSRRMVLLPFPAFLTCDFSGTDSCLRRAKALSNAANHMLFGRLVTTSVSYCSTRQGHRWHCKRYSCLHQVAPVGLQVQPAPASHVSSRHSSHTILGLSKDKLLRSRPRCISNRVMANVNANTYWILHDSHLSSQVVRSCRRGSKRSLPGLRLCRSVTIMRHPRG